MTLQTLDRGLIATQRVLKSNVCTHKDARSLYKSLNVEFLVENEFCSSRFCSVMINIVEK